MKDEGDYLNLLGLPLKHRKFTSAVLVASFVLAAIYLVRAPKRYGVEGLVEIATPKWEHVALGYVNPLNVPAYVLWSFKENASWLKVGENILVVSAHGSSLDEASAKLKSIVEGLNTHFAAEFNVVYQAQMSRVELQQARVNALSAEIQNLELLSKKNRNEILEAILQSQRSLLKREKENTSLNLVRLKEELPSTGASVARLNDSHPLSQNALHPRKGAVFLTALVLAFLFSLFGGAALEARKAAHRR